MKNSWKQLSTAILLMAGLFVAGCTDNESENGRLSQGPQRPSPAMPGETERQSPAMPGEAGRPEEGTKGLGPGAAPQQPPVPQEQPEDQEKPAQDQKTGRE